LGHVSSEEGDGEEAALAWIREGEEGWLPVLEYGIDVDIAIFPLADMTVEGDEKTLKPVGRAVLDSRALQLSGRIEEIERARR